MMALYICVLRECEWIAPFGLTAKRPSAGNMVTAHLPLMPQRFYMRGETKLSCGYGTKRPIPGGTAARGFIGICGWSFVPAPIFCRTEYTLIPQNSTIQIEAVLCPENATYPKVEWSITDAAGIPSYIATLEAIGKAAKITTIGDGEIWLRCMTRNGGEHMTIISQICLIAKGLGKPFLDPYEFIDGGLYTDTNAPLTNGNERGVATPRDRISYVGFQNVDFGSYGADTLTLPVFSLSPEPFPIDIWEGIPGEADSKKLFTVTYQSGSIWNTYIEETYALPRRIKGVKTICLGFNQKVHLKKFSFVRLEKGFSELAAAEYDALYGDTFRRAGDCVEGIGNNVTLRFQDMDFSKTRPNGIAITSKTPLKTNSIQLRLRHRKTGTEQ